MPNTVFSELRRQKIFHNKDFPLEILMHEYKTRTDRWHRHQDFYELVVICSGHARNENKVSSTMVQAGNVFLLPTGSVHRYREIHQFWHYNLLFDPALLTPNLPMLKQLPGYRMLFQMPPTTPETACSQLLSVDEGVLAHLIAQLEQMRSELALRAPGWQAVAYFSFLYFLAHLLRNCTPRNLRPNATIQKIGKVIRMLEEDSRKPYTLEKLASKVHMSVSSFRHHFTAVTGLSPGNFLIKLRIKKALLLLCSPASISRVAEQVGFQDSNYFARQFRNQTGMTPSEFQKKYRETPAILHTVMDKL